MIRGRETVVKVGNQLGQAVSMSVDGCCYCNLVELGDVSGAVRGMPK
jgi:hypothetical protein